LRPTFLFLQREKKKRAARGTKKKRRGASFGKKHHSTIRSKSCYGTEAALRVGFRNSAAAAHVRVIDFLFYSMKNYSAAAAPEVELMRKPFH